MCQPGKPRPQGASQDSSPSEGFQRAQSAWKRLRGSVLVQLGLLGLLRSLVRLDAVAVRSHRGRLAVLEQAVATVKIFRGHFFVIGRMGTIPETGYGQRGSAEP